ncbi:MAG: rRNA cytosine-C5-methyltransferase [Saprospiraceae bacterium]|nr:rRNA cytosine-C5-methyltransferase [Saprospiraceae bacterium]
MKLPLPTAFIDQMRLLLGADGLDEFTTALQLDPPVSIRLNQGKPVDFEQELSDRVPWHPYGFYLPERPVFTLDPLFHAGAYYVQEASSMFLYEALKQTVDFSKPLKALDLCAAPGGKSTLIADLLAPQGGLLVANETIRSRTGALRENLEKWGYPNIAITSAESEAFEALEGFFDIVVVDAPCSGEGLFRKDEEAVGEWSPSHVELCSARQKRILSAAVSCLAPGGILVFSTCTYNSSENSENVQWLEQNFSLEPQTLELPAEWGIESIKGGYQFFPHRLRGEGFFLSVLRKSGGQSNRNNASGNFKSITSLSKSQLPFLQGKLTGNFEAGYYQTSSGEILMLPQQWLSVYLTLDKVLKIKWFGTLIGELKGRDFIPSHSLALSRVASLDLPAVDVDKHTALRFLKKDIFELPAGIPNGWLLVRYNGLNLGWIKAMPNRMNNYLPQERRIRMDLQF